MFLRRAKSWVIDAMGSPRQPALASGAIGERVAGKRARGVVLLYHGVMSSPTDPWWIRVEPWRFAQQMRIIRKYLHPMSVRDLQAAAEADAIPRGAVAVTFDDGYVDNLKFAVPALEHSRIPATVFISTGYTGSELQYWWDELETILILQPVLPGTLALNVNGEQMEWSLEGAAAYRPSRDDRWWRAWNDDPPTARHQAYAALWNTLRVMEPDARESVMKELREWSKRPTYEGLCRPMNVNELQMLAKSEMVEIGAHTVSHCSLGNVSIGTQEREICESKTWLENTLQRGIESFSYPFGAQNDYSEATIGLLKSANFKRAMTNHGGIVETGVKPFTIPRVIAQSWPLSGFCTRMMNWLNG